MLRQDGPLRTPLSGFTTLTLIRLQVLRSCLFEPTVCCWFIFGPDRQLFSLACLVYRSQSVLKLRSVKLPMKENVSGYSRNPCSLNRERDTAFAAKLLTLPTGFFSAEKSEEWMARSPVWPDNVIASETASRHQPMNWRDSIWVQDSLTRRRSQSVLKLRSVSFPIQRTRVTRVTRDVLKHKIGFVTVSTCMRKFNSMLSMTFISYFRMKICFFVQTKW